MRNNLQIFSALILIAGFLLLSACGPAPNPKLQKSEQPQAEAPVPAVEQKPVIVPAEEPKPQVSIAPKRETPVKKVTPKENPTPQVINRKPPSPTPVETADSSAPKPPSWPASVAPPIAEPVAPPVEVAESRPVPVPPPAPRQIRVPSGTLVAIRMVDSVDSETASAGETFKASLDEPIVVDDETIFPKGSEVWVKLSKVQSAGRVSGRSELQLQLDRISLRGKNYLLESSTYVTTGASQGTRTAKSAGLGAAIGAAIGAIGGGGKGAVIGATTGAGAGAGVEAIRKGEQVRVDSETRLDFRLEDSLEVTLQSPSSTSPQRNNPSGPLRFGTRQ
jgi:hypothetical protein